jgi:uncharacterized DUF497 family protein
MKLPGIDWDENKNVKNKARHHGLSFEIAQYVFLDPNRIERRDESEGNTSGEERRQTLGKVGPIFFVVYEEIGENSKRIISARAAKKPERRSYEGYYRIDDKGWEKSST